MIYRDLPMEEKKKRWRIAEKTRLERRKGKKVVENRRTLVKGKE